MSVRRRLIVGAACMVLGTVLALLATDVLRWQGRLAWGDTRFEATPVAGEPWSLQQPLMPAAAETLLGIRDDLAYRKALFEFALGRPREEPFSDAELISQRGFAQEKLAAVVSSAEQDPRRRAEAANMIGVLGFANATIDPSQALTYLEGAVESFRQAVALDPSNADAKYNLELALTRLPPARQSADQNPSSNSQGGTGSGAGNGRAGSGY